MNLYEMWCNDTDFITAELWKYFQFVSQTNWGFNTQKGAPKQFEASVPLLLIGLPQEKGGNSF